MNIQTSSLLSVYFVFFLAATLFRWRGVRAYPTTPPPRLRERLRMNTGKFVSWICALLPNVVLVIFTITTGWTFIESVSLGAACLFIFVALMHTIPHL